MARPKKAEMEEKKILEKLFKRDITEYTIFENATKEQSGEPLISNFCIECKGRQSLHHFFAPYAEPDNLPEDLKKELIEGQYHPVELIENHDKISPEKRKYCYYILYNGFEKFRYKSAYNYRIENKFSAFFIDSIIMDILRCENKDIQQYLKSYLIPHMDENDTFSFDGDHKKKLEALKVIDLLSMFNFKWEDIEYAFKNKGFDELGKPVYSEDEIKERFSLLKEYISKHIIFATNFFYDTYIVKAKDVFYGFIKQKKHKKYFIEVDLTKPKEDIIKYIETIKDDFDDDPSKFDNIHDKLGLTPEIFQCSIKDCEIFTLGKRGTNKPINGIMADILFIYDCYKVGLSKKYIIGEINRYWNNIKKINTDEMSESTYRKYKKIAIDYIENQKYECYLTGYKNSPSKETKPDI